MKPITGNLDSCDGLDSRQFSIAVRRLADSLQYGTDSSPFVGSGIEYAQSRPYESGDPVKQIDWRVTARMGRPFIKEYEAPKQMPVYLLVDTSGSMCVSSVNTSKYAWAVQIAGGLALASLARMSPVGIVGCGERTFNSKPSLSRHQMFLWLHQLRHFRFDERTTLTEKLEQLSKILSNRVMLIVLSDLKQPKVIDRLKLLSQKHDCVVLQLIDPAEFGRLQTGIFRGEEAETKQTFVGHSRSRWFGEETANELRQGGIDHLELKINQPFIHSLRGFLRKRDCLGRGER
ncbi:MAG: DUF58 domain-containing protein [Verrucomicrobiota bacterium]|nr:DUF58 domain-containing protein [Verrucomicrobiota bacterium]MED5453611.1 DUF58 domain-containing protein [Verrucomicrobiota bacterium]